jgi:hypothetical protein
MPDLLPRTHFLAVTFFTMELATRHYDDRGR